MTRKERGPQQFAGVSRSNSGRDKSQALKAEESQTQYPLSKIFARSALLVVIIAFKFWFPLSLHCFHQRSYWHKERQCSSNLTWENSAAVWGHLVKRQGGPVEPPPLANPSQIPLPGYLELHPVTGSSGVSITFPLLGPLSNYSWPRKL